ncbi:hypothetical protein HAX54_011528, partial [Datura stramonium]|nr:hypothetical protein [Datura stramonium]
MVKTPAKSTYVPPRGLKIHPFPPFLLKFQTHPLKTTTSLHPFSLRKLLYPSPKRANLIHQSPLIWKTYRGSGVFLKRKSLSPSRIDRFLVAESSALNSLKTLTT